MVQTGPHLRLRKTNVLEQTKVQLILKLIGQSEQLKMINLPRPTPIKQEQLKSPGMVIPLKLQSTRKAKKTKLSNPHMLAIIIKQVRVSLEFNSISIINLNTLLMASTTILRCIPFIYQQSKVRQRMDLLLVQWVLCFLSTILLKESVLRTSQLLMPSLILYNGLPPIKIQRLPR